MDSVSMRRFVAPLQSIVYLLLLLFAAPSAFAVNPDTCVEDGGSAECTGPDVGPYMYIHGSTNWPAGLGWVASDQAGLDALVNYAFTTNHACTAHLENPPWLPVPSVGYGSRTVGDPAVLQQQSGDYWTQQWYLSVESNQVKHTLRIKGTRATTTIPPCGDSFWSGTTGDTRQRSVACPPGFRANESTSPIWQYCWRAAPAANAVEPRKNLGPCKDCELLVGHPANLATGNKYLEERDYAGSGPFPLEYTRRYNSMAVQGSSVSPGPDFYTKVPNWRGTYERAIQFSDHPRFPTALAYRHDGRVLRYKLVNGAFVPDADVNERLSRQVDGSGNTTGWTLITEQDETETYDATGRLIEIRNRSGITHTITYDVIGRIQTVRHSFGHQLAFAYDSQSRPLTITIPGGATLTYAYDNWSNLTSVTYPDSRVRQYRYENGSVPRGLTGIIDENSAQYATYTYNNSTGRVTSSQLAGGADSFSFVYTSATRTTITDALGQSRTHDYTGVLGAARGAATSTLCLTCRGSSKSKTFDANGNVASRTDFNNNQTTFVYDPVRNLQTSRTEAYGTPRVRTITTQWNATWRQPDLITEPNRTTAFTYDAMGSVLTRTVTDTSATPNVSRVWTFTYDSYGRVLTENGPRTDVSDITTYTYYTCTTGVECGQLHTVTNALTQTTTFNTYNAHGQPLTITDPNGVVTSLAYDGRQRLTSRQTGGETTTYTYWPTGLLKQVTLPDSSFVLYTYDPAHRLTKIADGEGNYLEYTLDGAGNRTAEKAYDPSNVLTRTRTQVFNSLNQLWKQVGSAGTAAVTTVFGYDTNGNQASIAAPLSRNTANQYDELNRLTQVTDPGTGVTQFAYDGNDNLTSVTDPRNNATSYSYNGFGDLTQLISPDTGTGASTYDSAGNLATSTDARSKTGTYSYDALNRVTSIAYPDLTTTFTYDAGAYGIERLTGASDANHSLSIAYDALGRVTGKSQTVGTLTKSVSYGYTNGNLTSLTTPSGQTIAYGYTDGRITSITLNGSTTFLDQVLYEPFGPASGWRWGNGTFAARVYDTDGKATTIDSAGASSYGYDDAFRITSISDLVDSNKSWTYGYDVLDRLNSAAVTGQSIGYTYDANGNRLSQSGTQSATYTVAGANNRISSITGSLARTYSYDAAGYTSGDATNTYTYNDAGRLITTTRAGLTTTYIYNALGQRVKKSNSSVARYFMYDEAGHLLGEYDGAGALVQETVWFDDIPVATLRPNGAGVSVYYIHTDHLNTPRRISRPSDNVIVWRWDSDPFGATAANEDPDADSSPFTYNVRFAGQYFDSESGVEYNYYRDGYDPYVGRYTQSDPIGLEGGINTYIYAGANPVMLADPSGLVPGPYTGQRKVPTPPTPSTGAVGVSVRCGSLPASMGGASGGVHCEVVATCKKTGETVGFGIGGGGNGIWERLFGGKTPPKYQEPRSAAPSTDVTQYTASCGSDGDCGCEAIQCLKKMQAGNMPPPYYAIRQNSNSYAHFLLNQCGCSVSGRPPGAVAW